MNKSLVIMFVCFIAGCSTTIPVNYVASPTSTIDNAKISVGDFRYLPGESGEVKPNQFQKASAAIGRIYLTENVSDLLKQSLTKELIASGAKVNKSAETKITGSVDKFLYDWLGFTEVDFYVDVTYQITKKGRNVYKETIKTKQSAPKTGLNDSEAIKQAISKNINQFISGYDFD